MRTNISENTGAGHVLLQPPENRHLWIAPEASQVRPVDMENPAQFTLLDQIPGITHGTAVAPGEINRSFHLGLCRRLSHLPGFIGIHGHGFFTHDVFAGSESRQYQWGVGNVGGNDVHSIDIVPTQEFL